MVQISVRESSTGRFHIFTLEPRETVISLKNRIMDKSGVPVLEQVIKSKKMILENHRTVESYRINNGDIVLCLKKSNESIN